MAIDPSHPGEPGDDRWHAVDVERIVTRMAHHLALLAALATDEARDAGLCRFCERPTADDPNRIDRADDRCVEHAHATCQAFAMRLAAGPHPPVFVDPDDDED